LADFTTTTPELKFSVHTGANMLASILNAIYREFLNSAVPGMAALGGRR
jgi:hypothetical protein